MIVYKRTSSDALFCGQFDFRIRKGRDIISFKENDYVACKYDNDWFIGIVEMMNVELPECQINFMHPKQTTSNVYWPQRPDKCLIPYIDVLTKIDVPSITSGGRTYKISSRNLALIKDILMGDYEYIIMHKCSYYIFSSEMKF